MEQDKISYLELPAEDLERVRVFYSSLFGWVFTSYGDDYIAFENAGIEGGFYRSEHSSRTEHGSVLVVLYSQNLEHTLRDVEAKGGQISKPIFSFPGGRRFQFLDPCGNELAVWSDKGE